MGSDKVWRAFFFLSSCIKILRVKCTFVSDFKVFIWAIVQTSLEETYYDKIL